MLEQVVKTYTAEKKEKDKTTLWVYYALRRISFLLTPVFLKLNISANQVSVLSIIAAVSGAVLIMVGDYPIVIVGALVMHFWLILDCVDGNVARYRGTFTRLGLFLEDTADCLVPALLFSSIGIAASKEPGYIPPVVNLLPYHFVILGTWSSFVVIFRKLIFRNFQITFWAGKEQKNRLFFDSPLFYIVYKAGQELFGIYSFIHIVILLAAIFKLLGMFTLIYFLANTTGMLLNVFKMLRKATQLSP